MTTEELTQLITEYGKHVYSFCCNLTGNRTDAEDLYQDTILKAVELRHRLDSSGNPKSYLMGISIRLWQNQKRKYAIRQNLLPLEELHENTLEDIKASKDQPEDESIKNEMIRTVRMGLKQLPEKLQTVMYLYYTAELAVEEIGKILHIPKGTVKSRLHKGRMLMKDYLEVREYGT